MSGFDERRRGVLLAALGLMIGAATLATPAVAQRWDDDDDDDDDRPRRGWRGRRYSDDDDDDDDDRRRRRWRGRRRRDDDDDDD